MTNTPFSGSKYPEIAKCLQIHISTAFYWRHKILNALGSLGYKRLEGIVESDETFFRESLKDRREITHRKSKKRGEKDSKRGISNQKIAVVVAQDRNRI